MKVLKTFQNGEHEACIVLKGDDKVYCSDGQYICDYDDEEIDEKIENFIECWYESNWSLSDWAAYYGCDESDFD